MESIIWDYMAKKLLNSVFYLHIIMALWKDNLAQQTYWLRFRLKTKIVDKGYGVDIVYLDYWKALDSVNYLKNNS